MISQLIQAKEDLTCKEVNECYDIKKTIGEGAYGKVNLVCCKQTKQKLALKQLQKAKVNFRDFKRELNYSYFLSAHPNVVTTYAVAFQSSDCWVFIQELSHHGDLLSSLKPGFGLGVQPTKLVMKQLAGALSFMHSKNLCHRDVKPENILLFDKENWFIKITDFGLTCREETVVRRNSGNTPYTPPEICDRVKNEGFNANKATDVWQAAITMFCLLTGTFPWDEATKSDKAYSNYCLWSQGKSASIAPRWSNFSPKLLKLFKKMLNNKRDERCSINILLKFIDCEWTRNSKLKRSTGSDASLDDDEYEVDNSKAKEALMNKLNDHGVTTVVSKSSKTERIYRWIESIQLHPQKPSKSEENAEFP